MRFQFGSTHNRTSKQGNLESTFLEHYKVHKSTIGAWAGDECE